MNYQLNENRMLNFRSIRFKTWLYFFAMTIMILAILLVIQIAFFASYYSTMKRNDLNRLGDSILDIYTEANRNNAEFERLVQEKIFTSGSSIVLFKADFTVTDNAVTVENLVNLLTTDAYGGESAPGVIPGLPVIDDKFYIHADRSERFSYITVLDGGSYIVYGAKVTDPRDGVVYIHVSSPLEQSGFIYSVIRRQSAISTALCGLLCIGLSLILSSRIAKPVSEFSKTARKLAGGDFTVRFEGEGFSEIEDLASTLNFATEEMGKTDRLRRELLANVSHDLRTPLTMVKAYAEMIRDLSGADPKKRANHCQTIIDEADRLTSLVNDIQNLSKLQSGTDILECGKTDLSALTRSVMERFDIYSSKEEYILKCEIDPGGDVNADEKKIEQVLYNLISNAINYTGDDKTVTVRVCVSPEKVYFAVHDTGKGIAPDEIDAVWERYYRASQSKRTRLGTGLGLSIVKNILILHKAEYGIQSTVGEGSTFWFSLPKFSPPSPDLPSPDQKSKRAKPGKNG